MNKIFCIGNLKECLKYLFCAGGGWAVPIIIEVLGIMKVGEGLAIVLIFTVSIGLCFLWEYLDGLIAYLMKSKEVKEQLHRERWQLEVDKFWCWKVGLTQGNKFLGRAEIEECCKLIDKLCKDRYLNIEDKKVLYDKLCLMWTEYDMGEVYKTIPPEIQKKWKKAQADDKLRQLKKDF